MSLHRFFMTVLALDIVLTGSIASSGSLEDGKPNINAEEFLPLAVGNSWTYEHRYDNGFGEGGPDPDPEKAFAIKEATITITSTEEFNGDIYYVFSDMPYNWPPPPDFFWLY